MPFSRALDRGLRRGHLEELVVVDDEVDCTVLFVGIVVLGRCIGEQDIGEELVGLDTGREAWVFVEELEVDELRRKAAENIDWV
jgi:hypothetical protein